MSTIPHRGSVTNMAKMIANANTAPISRLPAHREVAAIKRTATTKLASASDFRHVFAQIEDVAAKWTWKTLSGGNDRSFAIV